MEGLNYEIYFVQRKNFGKSGNLMVLYYYVK